MHIDKKSGIKGNRSENGVYYTDFSVTTKSDPNKMITRVSKFYLENRVSSLS